MNIQEFESEIQSLIDYNKIHKDIIKNQLEKFIKLYISTELKTIPLICGPHKIISVDLLVSNRYNDEDYRIYTHVYPNITDDYNKQYICECVDLSSVCFYDENDNSLKGFTPFAKWWYNNERLHKILNQIESFFNVDEGETYTISIGL